MMTTSIEAKLEAMKSVMCDVIKNMSKKEDCNEKWERKPAAEYSNSSGAAKFKARIIKF